MRQEKRWCGLFKIPSQSFQLEEEGLVAVEQGWGEWERGMQWQWLSAS